MDKSVSHLRNHIVMIQLYNRQIKEQLHENKDGIQDYQTHHQNLEATLHNQEEETLGLIGQSRKLVSALWWRIFKLTNLHQSEVLLQQLPFYKQTTSLLLLLTSFQTIELTPLLGWSMVAGF